MIYKVLTKQVIYHSHIVQADSEFEAELSARFKCPVQVPGGPIEVVMTTEAEGWNEEASV